MLDTEKILRAFSLCSDLEGEALSRYEFLCPLAGARLERRLRPGAGSPGEEDMDRLCNAAGAMAYADYLMLGSAPGGAVRVGDISLGSSSPAGADARELRDWCLAQVADLLLPEGPLPLEVIP